MLQIIRNTFPELLAVWQRYLLGDNGLEELIVEMMTAAVMYGPKDLRVEQVPRPVCEPDGMVIRIDAVGLCGSDIRNLTTDSRNGDYPHIIGHETVGTVVEVGPKVTKYKVGQRLFVHPNAPCLRCEMCRRGMDNMCLNLNTYATVQGGFAQYMPIPHWGVDGGNIWEIPDDIKAEHATLAEPLSSVYACQEEINVTLGDTVVVIGAGPIGCFHAELAKLRGAAKVIMVEINERRLQASMQFGVDHGINSSKTDPVHAVMDLTGGKGADKVISANPSTVAQQQAIFMCAPGGIVTFFGGVPRGVLTELDTNHIHYSNIWVYGHYGATSTQCKKALDLIIDRRFKAEKYITHVMPLAQINEAIELTVSGEAQKVVLIP